MVRTQRLGAAVILLLVVLLGAGCSPEVSNDSCGGGQGKRSVDEVVEVLVESARGDSVGSLCQVFEVQHERSEVEAGLEVLREAVDGEGGFDSVEITEKDQLGSDHILVITAPDGEVIREFSVFSTDGGRRFFLALATL